MKLRFNNNKVASVDIDLDRGIKISSGFDDITLRKNGDTYILTDGHSVSGGYSALSNGGELRTNDPDRVIESLISTLSNTIDVTQL
jgi:transketolase N-terminal domain/subunit